MARGFQFYDGPLQAIRVGGTHFFYGRRYGVEGEAEGRAGGSPPTLRTVVPAALRRVDFQPPHEM